MQKISSKKFFSASFILFCVCASGRELRKRGKLSQRDESECTDCINVTFKTNELINQQQRIGDVANSLNRTVSIAPKPDH